MRIGIDLGGTNTRVALIKDLKILKKITLSTKDSSFFIDNLIKIINNFLLLSKEKYHSKVTHIGLGIPGIIINNKLNNETNLKHLKNINIYKKLSDKFPKQKILIDNDANCFTQGEFLFGKLLKTENSAGVIIGTGLGIGLILNKKLYHGNGLNGELSVLKYKNSTYEKYCSGKFFGKSDASKKYFQLAQNNNSSALKKYEDFGKHLANVLLILINLLGLEKIVIGGSLAKANKYFKNSLKQEIKKSKYSRSSDTKIYFEKNMGIALLGSAYLDK